MSRQQSFGNLFPACCLRPQVLNSRGHQEEPLDLSERFKNVHVRLQYLWGHVPSRSLARPATPRFNASVYHRGMRHVVTEGRRCAQILEKRAGSGRFFENPRILFPDFDIFGLSSRARERDNEGTPRMEDR